MAPLEQDSSVVFYSLTASEIWQDKRVVDVGGMAFYKERLLYIQKNVLRVFKNYNNSFLQQKHNYRIEPIKIKTILYTRQVRKSFYYDISFNFFAVRIQVFHHDYW